MNTSGKYLWPAAAVLIGGVAAWVVQSTPKTSTAAYSASAPMQVPVLGAQPPGDVGDEAQGGTIAGQVLEIINVPSTPTCASQPKGREMEEPRPTRLGMRSGQP